MHVAQMLDTLYWGGAQMMQLFLVESLRPLGIELTIISLHDTSDSPVVSKLQAAGARIVTFPFPKLFSPGSFVKLVNFLRNEKFDLLHAYLTYSNIVGPLAGVLTGTPTIASLRNADFDRKDYSPQRAFLETMSLRYVATRVMANGLVVGEFARQRVKKIRSVDIIPNAVDFLPTIPQAERELLRQELIGDPRRPLILSIGRLTQAKGYFDLLEAFSIVHDQHPSATLVIVGRGKLLDELTARIDKLGLTGNVFLIGVRNDVPRLLASADIYVNSSHWEGTPVSVLEAMSIGLPVVATNVGENPYLLAENAGLLVPPNQPQELAAALTTMLASPEKCAALGQAARERVRLHYSRESWRRDLLKLYSEITPKADPFLAQISTKVLQASES